MQIVYLVYVTTSVNRAPAALPHTAMYEGTQRTVQMYAIDVCGTPKINDRHRPARLQLSGQSYHLVLGKFRNRG